MVSDTDDYLYLSDIQHMAFCERQWAMIHLEQQWAENIRTVEGKHLHQRADDPGCDTSRPGLRVVRAMPLVSHRLRLRGVADVVEFHQTEASMEGLTVRLEKRKGFWKPVPVEYKRGRPKPDDRDAVQLCAQAMALEEMMHVAIPQGFLFYGQTRHRETVSLDAPLRERTQVLAQRMYQLLESEDMPRAVKKKHCSLCSMEEICQPGLTARKRTASGYIRGILEEVKCEDC